MYTYWTLILPLQHTATHCNKLQHTRRASFASKSAHTRTPMHILVHLGRTALNILALLCIYPHNCTHTHTPMNILAHLCAYPHNCANTRTLCTYPHTCARTRYTFGHTRTPETRGSQHTRTPVHIPSQFCTYAHTFGHTRTHVHILAHLRCVALKRETPTTTYK